MAGPKTFGDDEERILLRIGAAVVVLWKDFPELQQSRIIQQAVLTPDRVRTVQLNEEIRAFIRKRRWPDAPSHQRLEVSGIHRKLDPRTPKADIGQLQPADKHLVGNRDRPTVG